MIGVGAYAKTEKSLGNIGKSLPWFMDPANIFLIIGCIIFTLAFLGCIGSLRENITILKTVCRIFFVFIIILFIFLLMEEFCLQDHPFSAYTKFSEKLTFLTYQEIRSVIFSENFVYALINEWSQEIFHVRKAQQNINSCNEMLKHFYMHLIFLLC